MLIQNSSLFCYTQQFGTYLMYCVYCYCLQCTIFSSCYTVCVWVKAHSVTESTHLVIFLYKVKAEVLYIKQEFGKLAFFIFLCHPVDIYR